MLYLVCVWCDGESIQPGLHMDMDMQEGATRWCVWMLTMHSIQVTHSAHWHWSSRRFEVTWTNKITWTDDERKKDHMERGYSADDGRQLNFLSSAKQLQRMLHSILCALMRMLCSRLHMHSCTNERRKTTVCRKWRISNERHNDICERVFSVLLVSWNYKRRANINELFDLWFWQLCILFIIFSVFIPLFICSCSTMELNGCFDAIFSTDVNTNCCCKLAKWVYFSS